MKLSYCPDSDTLRVGTIIAVSDVGPFFLYGFVNPADAGTVGITNAPAIGKLGVPLWRFRTREQAEAASHVVETHARLDVDAETRFVPEAREARTLGECQAALNTWGRRISPEIERAIAEAGLGSGAYPLILDSVGSRLQ
jgi:hypothetical protein